MSCNKINLDIPFNKKDEAKLKYGSAIKFNPETKRWWVFSDSEQSKEIVTLYSKNFFSVSYEQREKAKEQGMLWDPTHRLWFAYGFNENLSIINDMFKKITVH